MFGRIWKNKTWGSTTNNWYWITTSLDTTKWYVILSIEIGLAKAVCSQQRLTNCSHCLRGTYPGWSHWMRKNWDCWQAIDSFMVGIFHYKPSIIGCPHFRKPPNHLNLETQQAKNLSVILRWHLPWFMLRWFERKGFPFNTLPPHQKQEKTLKGVWNIPETTSQRRTSRPWASAATP